jgi:hypothetical protein
LNPQLPRFSFFNGDAQSITGEEKISDCMAGQQNKIKFEAKLTEDG